MEELLLNKVKTEDLQKELIRDFRDVIQFEMNINSDLSKVM